MIDRIRRHAERLALYLDFLDLVLEEEVGVREGRRFRNARASRPAAHKTLDELHSAFQPDLDSREVWDLATSGFVRAGSHAPCSANREANPTWP